ncbi:MAG: hypothetical protein LBH60_02010 [Prevotellaceae bacterium]|jgi:hypothetical protein|nr:hypothetical protein [Prevotellaceae bacterium]
MKKTVFAIVLCCFFATSRAQFDNTLSELELKGKVSSLVEREYQLTNYDYNSKKEERKAIFLFNADGRKIEEKYTDPSNKVLYLGVFKYAPSGELIEEKVNNIEYGKNFVKKYVADKGNITVNIEVESETPQMYAKYILDAWKNVVRRIEYDRGKTVRTFVYTYDSRGKVQSETQEMQNTSINFKYAYNSRGQLEKKTEVNASGKIIHTQFYSYNNNGNVDTEITSYADDPQKLTLKYKYKFDSAGNWTEKQEFMDGNLFSVITREISYY